MESRIQAFEILWSNRMQRPPPLARTEEYDDPFELMRSWLVRTTADRVTVTGGEPEEINAEAYWADVFGNWAQKDKKEQAVEHEDEMAAYWTEMFGDWGQDQDEGQEEWDPLDYEDTGEVYDMLLLE